jgi:RNA polymerase sigma-70 factor (ECF subfamily)
MSGTVAATIGYAGRHPFTGTSDRSLVEQAQHGSQRAFAELVARHDGRLRALARRLLKEPARVDDALQETYLKAFRTIDRFRGDANVGTWLYRIAYNTCLDELRRRQPVVGLDRTYDPPSAEPGPAESAVARIHASELLRDLPEPMRATVVLVDGYGLDYDEASRLLDVPAGTVASRVSRSRRRLRQAGMRAGMGVARDAA